MSKTAIVIPAYNEEKTIGRVISGIRRHVKDPDIIVVDDGSTDATAEKCRGAKVVQNKGTMGVGAAVRIGIMEAIKRSPDNIAIIDADGEYDPKDIKKAIAGLENADLVLGSRFLKRMPEMKALNKIGNIFFSGLTSLIIGKNITDSQTGLRAMKTEVARNLELSGGYTYTQEMVIQAAKRGHRISEVAISYAKRKNGQSRVAKNVFAYGLRVLPLVLRAGWKSTAKKERKVSAKILNEDILELPCDRG